MAQRPNLLYSFSNSWPMLEENGSFSESSEMMVWLRWLTSKVQWSVSIGFILLPGMVIFLYKNVAEDLEMCAISPIKEGSKDAYISLIQCVGSADLKFESTSKELKRKKLIKTDKQRMQYQKMRNNLKWRFGRGRNRFSGSQTREESGHRVTLAGGETWLSPS